MKVQNQKSSNYRIRI